MARFGSFPDTPSERPTLDPKANTWRLVIGDRSIELPEGASTLGRAATCNIVLDVPGASRLHARVQNTNGQITIDDLGSANGVFVNGEKIHTTRPLYVGDRIVIGTQDLVVERSSKQSVRLWDSERPTLARSVTPEPAKAAVDVSQLRWEPVLPQPVSTDTENLQAIDALGRVADRMLAKGRADIAIKILNGHLRGVLDAINKGETVPDPSIAGAVHYAMKLACATHEGRWIDYVLDLHVSLRRVLESSVTRLISLEIEHGTQIDRALLDGYKLVIREMVKKGDAKAKAHSAEIERLAE